MQPATERTNLHPKILLRKWCSTKSCNIHTKANAMYSKNNGWKCIRWRYKILCSQRHVSQTPVIPQDSQGNSAHSTPFPQDIISHTPYFTDLNKDAYLLK